jgi:hypothetical protein
MGGFSTAMLNNQMVNTDFLDNVPIEISMYKEYPNAMFDYHPVVLRFVTIPGNDRQWGSQCCVLIPRQRFLLNLATDHLRWWAVYVWVMDFNWLLSIS